MTELEPTKRSAWRPNARRAAGAVGLLGVSAALASQIAAEANYTGTQQVAASADTAGDLYLQYGTSNSPTCTATPGDSNCRLTLAVDNLYPGNSQYRIATVKNAGSLNFSALQLALTATSAGSVWNDSTNGATITVDVCLAGDGVTPTAWVEAGGPDFTYSCTSGQTQTVLTTRAISSITSPTAFSGSKMLYSAGGTNYYRMTFTIPTSSVDPATAGGTPAIQGTSATLAFTFSGDPRAATAR